MTTQQQLNELRVKLDTLTKQRIKLLNLRKDKGYIELIDLSITATCYKILAIR